MQCFWRSDNCGIGLLAALYKIGGRQLWFESESDVVGCHYDAGGVACCFVFFDFLAGEQVNDCGFYDSSRRRNEKGQLVEQTGNSGFDICRYCGCNSYGLASRSYGFKFPIVLCVAAGINVVLCEAYCTIRDTIYEIRDTRYAMVCFTSCSE